MIVGFMGKGGSGKTTMSTLFARHLVARGSSVLAIDADHNMDFLYNLGAMQEGFPYLGQDRQAIKEVTDMRTGERFHERLLREPRPSFGIDPLDAFTEAHSLAIGTNLRVMAAGPHTEEVFSGEACSHVLSSALKLYLPCLDLHEGEAAVVDSTAGMDMVGTGIATGMDYVFICAEPTVHATKTAKQIAEGLERYGVLHTYVLTKTQNEEQRVQAEVWLSEPVRFVIPFGAGLEPEEAVSAMLESMWAHVQKGILEGGSSLRRDRKVR